MKQAQFLDLIESHAGIIHKVIRLYVDHPEDRKDLFQEIVLQSWKSISRFRGESKFSSWLYRVSLNTVLTFKKRSGQNQTVPLEEAQKLKQPETSNAQVDMLWRVVYQLNDIDKMVITLHLEGYQNQEISEITGITKNHVAVKLRRAKQEVLNKLKAQESWI